LEFDNNRLHVGDVKIDIVYKRLLVNEYLQSCAISSAARCLPRRAVLRGKQFFRSKLIHKKALFAVLTDQRRANLFTSDERDVIQKACSLDTDGQR